MKKVMLLVLTLVVVLTFAGCGQRPVDYDKKAGENESKGSTEVKQLSPEEVVEEFFLLYSQSDLDGMKQYCSDNFVELYFGTGTVLGNMSATAQKIEIVEGSSNGKEVFLIEAEISPDKNSALFGEETTSFYLALIENQDKNWVIDEFFTG